MSEKSNIDLSNHSVLKYSEEIRQICSPLKDFFGITSFVFYKSYLDGSHIRLGTHADWLEHFYEKSFYQASVFEVHPDKFTKSFVLWSQVKSHQEILKDARDYFNIDHGITLVQPVEGACEF